MFLVALVCLSVSEQQYSQVINGLRWDFMEGSGVV